MNEVIATSAATLASVLCIIGARNGPIPAVRGGQFDDDMGKQEAVTTIRMLKDALEQLDDPIDVARAVSEAIDMDLTPLVDATHGLPCGVVRGGGSLLSRARDLPRANINLFCVLLLTTYTVFGIASRARVALTGSGHVTWTVDFMESFYDKIRRDEDYSNTFDCVAMTFHSIHHGYPAVYANFKGNEFLKAISPWVKGDKSTVSLVLSDVKRSGTFYKFLRRNVKLWVDEGNFGKITFSQLLSNLRSAWNKSLVLPDTAASRRFAMTRAVAGWCYNAVLPVGEMLALWLIIAARRRRSFFLVQGGMRLRPRMLPAIPMLENDIPDNEAWSDDEDEFAVDDASDASEADTVTDSLPSLDSQ